MLLLIVFSSQLIDPIVAWICGGAACGEEQLALLQPFRSIKIQRDRL